MPFVCYVFAGPLFLGIGIVLGMPT